MFSIDLRSLAVFRMALGILLLADLALRAQDLSAHYTDWGVLPRNILIPHLSDPLPLSVHLVSGSAFGQAIIFLVAGVFALALLVGFRTPLVTCASWLLLLSVQARNPMLLHSGDMLLRMLLFWGMFVPLGARYSLDSLIRRSGADRAPLPTSVRSVGTAALLLQVCLVYWCTAALKSWEGWWDEGSAVYYALSIDQMATPFGLWLLGFPDLLVLLSRVALALEYLGPCLAFVPFWTPYFRIGVVGLFFCFHIGLALCLRLELFPYISMVSWLVFVPGLVWDRGWHLLPRRSLTVGQSTSSASGGWSRLSLAPDDAPPTPEPLRSSRLAQAVAAFFLAYVMLWNLLGFQATSSWVRPVFPPAVSLVGYLLRLDQYWGMFSPFPFKDDGWLVVPGTLKNGSRVDLWTGQRRVQWEKPVNVLAHYPTERWRKYMEKTRWRKEGREIALDAYARYVCRDWNARHRGPGRLETFRIFYMEETTLPDYQHVPPEKKLLGEYACGERP